ncbi:hypothetical protein [Limosilactobacillus reuteri]|uniref:hypothetical protein n=1 Tax=Limosilactobacillus reuteri TaxID=1598 RepID=UPI001CDB7C30|nr:hypothetical protein [Limosilactobacillus reuteri]
MTIEHLLIPVIATLVIESIMYYVVVIFSEGDEKHIKSSAETMVAISTPIILGIYGIMSLMPW